MDEEKPRRAKRRALVVTVLAVLLAAVGQALGVDVPPLDL